MLGRIANVGLSVALHAGVIALVASNVTHSVTVPQQQMVEVTLQAEPEMVEAKQSLAPMPKKAEQKQQAAQVKEVAKLEPVAPIHEIMTDASPVQKHEEAKQAAAPSAVTTPVFDAAYLNNPPPHYPSEAKHRSIEGRVVLDVRVSAEGHATHVSVDDSSGSDLLDEAALEAVSNWKFIPASANGENVASSVRVPVVFKLK